MGKTGEVIKGVSSSSMVELKAALFQKEQEAKKYKERGEKAVKKGRISKRKREEEIEGSTAKNKGVEERSKRDVSTVGQAGDPTAEEIDQKLREKQRLYSQFIQKGDYNEELMVDFEKKNWEGEGREEGGGKGALNPHLAFLNNFVSSEVIDYSTRRDDELLDSSLYEQARESRKKAVQQLSLDTSSKRSQVELLKRRKLADKHSKLLLIQQMKKHPPGLDKHHHHDDVIIINNNIDSIHNNNNLDNNSSSIQTNNNNITEEPLLKKKKL